MEIIGRIERVAKGERKKDLAVKQDITITRLKFFIFHGPRTPLIHLLIWALPLSQGIPLSNPRSTGGTLGFSLTANLLLWNMYAFTLQSHIWLVKQCLCWAILQGVSPLIWNAFCTSHVFCQSWHMDTIYGFIKTLLVKTIFNYSARHNAKQRCGLLVLSAPPLLGVLKLLLDYYRYTYNYAN